MFLVVVREKSSHSAFHCCSGSQGRLPWKAFGGKNIFESRPSPHNCVHHKQPATTSPSNDSTSTIATTMPRSTSDAKASCGRHRNRDEDPPDPPPPLPPQSQIGSKPPIYFNYHHHRRRRRHAAAAALVANTVFAGDLALPTSAAFTRR